MAGLIISPDASFHQGHEGRFNSAACTAFLERVPSTDDPTSDPDSGPGTLSHERRNETVLCQHTQRLTVYQLPSYSPDYNPIEKLWKKIKQRETHLHYFPTFEALSEKVEQALLKFEHAPQEILTLCSLPEELAWAA